MSFPISWLPLFLGAPIAIVVLIILYYTLIKPIVQYPLPNEQDEGYWKIPLPQLGEIYEGQVTTARRFFQNHYAKLIQNADPKQKEALVRNRNAIMKYKLFAQRVGREKVIYLFDKNPMDTQFHMREDKAVRFGADIQVRFLYNVQDCMRRKREGAEFQFIFVKLGTEKVAFTEDERLQHEKDLEALDFIKTAALNVEAKAYERDEKERYKKLFDQSLLDLGKSNSERATALRALANKNLLAPATPPELKTGYFRGVSKKFFSWLQVAIALLAYLIVPNIMASAEIYYPDPQTVAVGVAFAAFIVTPLVRGLIKK